MHLNAKTCAHCGADTGVVETRTVQIGNMVCARRRRKCQSCGKTGHTLEIPEPLVGVIDFPDLLREMGL